MRNVSATENKYVYIYIYYNLTQFLKLFITAKKPLEIIPKNDSTKMESHAHNLSDNTGQNIQNKSTESDNHQNNTSDNTSNGEGLNDRIHQHRSFYQVNRYIGPNVRPYGYRHFGPRMGPHGFIPQRCSGSFHYDMSMGYCNPYYGYRSHFRGNYRRWGPQPWRHNFSKPYPNRPPLGDRLVILFWLFCSGYFVLAGWNDLIITGLYILNNIRIGLELLSTELLKIVI